MDPITLAIISMIGSAGLQAFNADRAASSQKNAALQAQQRQLASQNQATQVAARKASEFDPTQRQAAQDAITQELTAGLDKQVAGPQITAQGTQIGSTLPDGDGGAEYSVARGKEQAKSAASLHALAGLMGRIGSASQLRQNEAVGIGDAAGAIGRIGSGAENIFQADQAGIQAAGRPNIGMQVASSALGAYGASQLAGAGLGAAGARTNDMGILAKATKADPMGWWLKNGTGGD